MPPKRGKPSNPQRSFNLRKLPGCHMAAPNAGNIRQPAPAAQIPAGQQPPAAQIQAGQPAQVQLPAAPPAAQIPFAQVQPPAAQAQRPLGQVQLQAGYPQHQVQQVAPHYPPPAQNIQMQGDHFQQHMGQIQPQPGPFYQAQAGHQNRLPFQVTPIDPNMAAHIDSMDRSTEVTAQLLERLSTECSQSLRKEELHEVLKAFENASTNQRRGPQVTLPHFSGDADSSFEEFGREYEERCEFLKWPPDHPNSVKVMPTLLTGLAKIKYRQMDHDVKNDYHTLMGELQKLFELQSQNAMHVYQQLDRMQKPGETVND